MKKLILALTMLTIAITGTAFAGQFDTNNIGIYLSDGNHSTTAIMGESINLHLVVSNMTANELAGFELKMIADGSLAILGGTIAYPTDAINLATRQNEYIVGFDAPVPVLDGTMEVMTFDALYFGDGLPAGIRIDSVYFSSLDGVPSFLVDADTGELVEMHQSTGGANDQVFLVNADNIPVATESTTFDSLKSLYR